MKLGGNVRAFGVANGLLSTPIIVATDSSLLTTTEVTRMCLCVCTCVCVYKYVYEVIFRYISI